MPRQYKEKIALIQTGRGVWGIDPFKGCTEGIGNNPRGCYGVCYAANIAKFRGYDFSKTINRNFWNGRHIQKICGQLLKIPFVRIGIHCDPSHDWKHTLNIIETIRPYQKNIVIITKHWTNLSIKQLEKLEGITVNTSISALDKYEDLVNRLKWYNILKTFCKSILRVNTVRFNLDNMQGKLLNRIQEKLLGNEKVIDNVLRFPRSHKLAKDGIIFIQKEKYYSGYANASKNNINAYMGNCQNCPDQCGINL